LAVAQAQRAQAELQASRAKRLADQGAAPILDRDNADTALLIAHGWTFVCFGRIIISI
jgi:multidrug resistance efflux pump